MRITLVTNLPAPYRQPIWDELAINNQLKVVFLLGNQNWRGWQLNARKKWSYEFLNLKMWKFRELEVIPWPLGSKRLANNSDVLILSGWHTPIYIFLSFYAKKRNIKIIQIYESFESNSQFRSRFIKFVKSRILNQADRIITLSSDSAEYIKQIGVNPNKIVVLFNPIQYEDWMEKIPEKELNFNRKSFLYVGQLIKRKGIDQLIKAYDLLEDEEYELDIVGTGAMQSELINLARQCKKSNKIRFHGSLTGQKLYEKYASNNIFVLPSSAEVWGLVANEALSCGLHLVISSNCGASNFVEGMKGVHVYSGGMDELQRALTKSITDFDHRVVAPEILNFDCKKFAHEMEQLLYKLNLAT